jgi:protein-disulfide isomerase
MVIEFIYSEASCTHCINQYNKILEVLRDYPNDEDVVEYNILDTDYEKMFELASKYGFLETPMIIADGQILFRNVPSKKSLFLSLDKINKQKCKVIEQEQILLY